MSVTTADGALEIGPGDFYSIPPDHDASVVGEEPAVGVELLSAADFAKSMS